MCRPLRLWKSIAGARRQNGREWHRFGVALFPSWLVSIPFATIVFLWLRPQRVDFCRFPGVNHSGFSHSLICDMQSVDFQFCKKWLRDNWVNVSFHGVCNCFFNQSPTNGDYTLICESLGNYTFQFFNPETRSWRLPNDQVLSNNLWILCCQHFSISFYLYALHSLQRA